MNANELADDIKKIRIGEYSSPTEQRWLFKIETMLRQQQAEIEALKKQLQLHKNAHHEALKFTAKTLTDGGEPVKNATYWKRQCNLLQSSLTNLQSSLYHANEQIKYLESHPAKTLTDGEILEIYHDVYVKHHNDGIDFARAILKKASEK